MSIIAKRNRLLTSLDDSEREELQSVENTYQKKAIIRKLCEKEVTIDLDEEPDFDGEDL
jgi:hypothetical protein